MPDRSGFPKYFAEHLKGIFTESADSPSPARAQCGMIYMPQLKSFESIHELMAMKSFEFMVCTCSNHDDVLRVHHSAVLRVGIKICDVMLYLVWR